MQDYLLEFGSNFLWALPYASFNIAGLLICIHFRNTAKHPSKLGIIAFSIHLVQQILSPAFRAWFSLSFPGLAPMSKIDMANLATRGFLSLAVISGIADIFLLIAIYRALSGFSRYSAPNPALNPDAASASHRPILPRRYGSAG